MLTIYKNLNAALDLLSIIIVPTLIIVCSFWLIEPVTINTVTSDNNFLAVAGSTSKVYSPILVISNSKLEYSLSLIDSTTNRVVYKYPVYYSGNLAIKSVNVKIPDDIKPAIYSLIAVIKYKLNPIKQGAIRVELAHITIVNKV
jgi:hypothetical protein